MTSNPLTIDRVNPLEHAEKIKALFAHEGAEGAFFAPFFESAYPQAVADGAWSWIGRDRAGAVVMHVACFPHRFAYGTGILTGGLGVNLMVARPYRTLLPAVSLLQRLIADTRNLAFDFLYADPNPPGRAALKAMRFTPVGDLERCALPLTGRTPIESVAVLGYRMWDALRRPGQRVPMHRWPATTFNDADWARPTVLDGAMVPIHSRALYERRLRGYPSEVDHWFTDRETAAQSSVAILVRGPVEGIATIGAIRRRSTWSIRGVVAGVASAIRAMGATRLQAWCLGGSTLADELHSSGLVPRRDSSALMVLGLTEAGKAVADQPRVWQITDVDCDR